MSQSFDFSSLNNLAVEQKEIIKAIELAEKEEKERLRREEEQRRKREADAVKTANFSKLFGEIQSKLQRRVLPNKAKVYIEKHIEEDILAELRKNQTLLESCEFTCECTGAYCTETTYSFNLTNRRCWRCDNSRD